MPDAEILTDLRVPATPEGMDQIHAALGACRDFLQRSRTIEQEWFDEFVLAVAEVSANIIQYAYPPDAPDPCLTLSVTQTSDHLKARLVDWGTATFSPGDVTEMLTAPGALETLRDRGRGLAIIRMTTDHFTYDRTPAGENIWVIAKLMAISH